MGDVTARAELAMELSKQGKSQRQIAAELGVSAATVNKYLKKASVHSVNPVNTVNAVNSNPKLNTLDLPELFEE